MSRVAASACRADPPVIRPNFAAALTEAGTQLRGRAKFLTQNQDEAEDLVQSVFERALRARDRFEDGSNLQAWLHSIMRNLYLDRCRSRRLYVPLRDAPMEWSDDAPQTPLETLSLGDVLSVLATLKAADRTILDLALLQRRPYREIAAVLGLRPITAGTRIHRARLRLKQALEVLHEARIRPIVHR